MAEHYVVTRTERTSVINAEGRPVLGRRIWYRVLATNSIDFVEITDDDFSPDAIRAAIDAAVEVLLALIE